MLTLEQIDHIATGADQIAKHGVDDPSIIIALCTLARERLTAGTFADFQHRAIVAVEQSDRWNRQMQNAVNAIRALKQENGNG
jgi:U3 small nucleolar ribonucleoprotein component